MCGKPAKHRVTAPGRKWGRWCCGTHANAAERRGWTREEPATMEFDTFTRFLRALLQVPKP